MKIDEIINAVNELPTAPAILPKLSCLLNDSECDMREVVNLIHLDAALTAQVIKTSNSAYYGSERACSGLSQAVQTIGLDTLYQVVSRHIAQSTLSAPLGTYSMMQGELYDWSMQCALTMMALADNFSLDEDDAYTVGLLHGLGKVIIEAYYQENTRLGIYYNTYERALTVEDEKRALGYVNGEIAAALLRRWRFPETICTPIEFQTQPLSASDQQSMSVLLWLSLAAIRHVRNNPHNPFEGFSIRLEMFNVYSLTDYELLEAAQYAFDYDDKQKMAG